MRLPSDAKIQKQADVYIEKLNAKIYPEYSKQTIGIYKQLNPLRKRWDEIRDHYCFAPDGMTKCICKEHPEYLKYFNLMKPLTDKLNNLYKEYAQKICLERESYVIGLMQNRAKKRKYLDNRL